MGVGIGNVSDLTRTNESTGVNVVTVWFDYSCPHCHLGLQRLEALAGDLHFAIDRRPYLLRPDAPISAVYGQGRSQESKSPRRNSAGSPILALPDDDPGVEPFSSRSLSTVLAHEATACAKDQGKEQEFYCEVAREYWERGSDLGSIDTLRSAAIKAQVDGAAMWTRLESSHYRQWVMEEHWAAVHRGVTGIPSYLVSGKLCSGDMSLEDLRRVIVEGS